MSSLEPLRSFTSLSIYLRVINTPPKLGAALLCSSWAGSDVWLDPEFDHLRIVHRDGVTTIGLTSDFLGNEESNSKPLLLCRCQDN